MDLDLPNHLHSTRDLLMRSLVMHPEPAPAMPAGLATDLSARFVKSRTAAPAVAPLSWMEKVRGLFASPAFGLVAAAVVVLGVAIPMIPASSTFRGQDTALTAEAVRIVFVGENPDVVSHVKASGNFEPSAISSVVSATDSSAISGPAVIVDFRQNSLTAIDREGKTVHRADLPGDVAGATEAIGLAVTRL